MKHNGKRRSLLLVNPKRRYRFNWDLQEVCELMGKKTQAPPLALPLLAAITPERYDIRIVDEEMGPLPAGARPDLVGITAMISNVRRAYEIADGFRARGVPVVMGGPQVSFDVEEALEHADSVVVGEAEDVWEECLEGFESGSPEQVYRSASRHSFERSPAPRWDLYDVDKIVSFSVQVSRGCPNHCEFCLVRNMFGSRQRYRDLDNVIDEIRALPRRLPISFADDNLCADKSYARKLMERLAPLNVSWNCQTGIDTAYDADLLRMMSRAGCSTILVGFESLNPDSLAEARKSHNDPKRYREAIENTHRAGIHLIASFVVGFDNDTPQDLPRIHEFTREHGISFVMLNALGAYPGSSFYEKMLAADRIVPVSTDLFNGIIPTMRYVNFSRTEMFNGIIETLEKIYSYENLAAIAPGVLGNGAFKDIVVADIDLWARVRTTARLARTHLLSGDSHARRLFTDLFGLVRQGRTEMAAVAQYLLFILSFRGYLEFNRRYRDEILSQIEEE